MRQLTTSEIQMFLRLIKLEEGVKRYLTPEMIKLCQSGVGYSTDHDTGILQAKLSLMFAAIT